VVIPDPHVGSYVAAMSESETYEIRVQGRLDGRWSAWFDGMALVAADDGSTLIRGQVADQAALHGLIQKVRDLGLPLLSVTLTQAGPREASRPT
jgi:hypothetical protein